MIDVDGALRYYRSGIGIPEWVSAFVDCGQIVTDPSRDLMYWITCEDKLLKKLDHLGAIASVQCQATIVFYHHPVEVFKGKRPEVVFNWWELPRKSANNPGVVSVYASPLARCVVLYNAIEYVTKCYCVFCAFGDLRKYSRQSCWRIFIASASR